MRIEIIRSQFTYHRSHINVSTYQQTNMYNNIRAEFAATQLYDGLEGYSVRKAGAASKGYCPDLLTVEPRLQTAELSRNGLLRMLPEALFFREDWLRSATNDDEKKRRIETLKRQKSYYETYFEAFDTLFFRQEIAAQKAVDAAEVNREALMLKEIYGIDISRMRNSYLRKLALCLLDAGTIKGDLPLLAFCARTILCEKVSYQISNRVDEEVSPMAYRRVTFIVHVEGLTNEEYRARMEQYEEFFRFMEQWFLPYDCEMDYCIKDYRQRFVLGEPLTLDYNTRL